MGLDGGNAWGRKALSAMDRFRHYYHRHEDRYHVWNETHYRFYTRLVAAAAILVILAALAGAFKVGRTIAGFIRKNAGRRPKFFLAGGDYRNAALSARQALVLIPTMCRHAASWPNRRPHPFPADVGMAAEYEQNEPTVENKLILAAAGLNYQKPPSTHRPDFG